MKIWYHTWSWLVCWVTDVSGSLFGDSKVGIIYEDVRFPLKLPAPTINIIIWPVDNLSSLLVSNVSSAKKNTLVLFYIK